MIPAVAFSPDDYYGRLYPVPAKYVNDIMATEAEKWEVLATLGIGREMGPTPLSAWRNATQVINGETSWDDVDVEKQNGVLDIGFSRTYVRKFVFYLA